MSNAPDLITFKEASLLTGYSMSRLRRLKRQGFPPAVVLGHAAKPDLFDKQQVLAWMNDAAGHRARKAKPRYAGRRPWLEELIAP